MPVPRRTTSRRCKFYADHFHCFGCGEHGDRIDWLTRGEGLSREEAIALIRDWDGPATPRRPTERAEQDRARAGAVGAGRADRRHPRRALSRRDPPHRRRRAAGEHQRQPALPSPAARSAPGPLRPCLLALMRDPESDQPIGIQRIALELREGRVASSTASPSAASARSSCGRPERSWSSAKDSRPRSRPPPASPIAARRCSRPGRRSRAAAEPVPGDPGRRAADHPGRPRRQWRRPGRRGALHGALDPRRAHRRAAHARSAPAPISTTSSCRSACHESMTPSPRTSRSPCPEGRGVTIDDFVAYLPSHVYIFTPCREIWTGASVNARLPRDAGAHQEPASPSATRTASPSPSPPPPGSTAIARSSR